MVFFHSSLFSGSFPSFSIFNFNSSLFLLVWLKASMVNSSLAYEILLYINSFYFGLFATCELGTLILKSVLILGVYEVERNGLTKLGQDYGVLVGLCVIEAIRLILGRKGSLSERGKSHNSPSWYFTAVLKL